MTVAELAKKLNTTIPEIFEHYKRILVDIPQDETYVFSTDQIKRAIPKYEAEEKPEQLNQLTELKPKLVPIKFEDLKSQLEEQRTKRVEILDNLEPYFKKGDGTLLKEFKKHNSIPDLILEGDFRKVTENDFGFFKNIGSVN